jgi:hypothetical protein
MLGTVAGNRSVQNLPHRIDESEPRHESAVVPATAISVPKGSMAAARCAVAHPRVLRGLPAACLLTMGALWRLTTSANEPLTEGGRA